MRNQGFAIRVVDVPLYNGAVVDRTTPIRRAALSADTTAEAQQLQIRLWRRMSDSERLQAVSDVSRAVEELALSGIRLRYPAANERECFLRLAVIRLGAAAVRKLYPDAETVLDGSP